MALYKTILPFSRLLCRPYQPLSSSFSFRLTTYTSPSFSPLLISKRTIIASDPHEIRLNNLRDNPGAVIRVCLCHNIHISCTLLLHIHKNSLHKYSLFSYSLYDLDVVLVLGWVKPPREDIKDRSHVLAEESLGQEEREDRLHFTEH